MTIASRLALFAILAASVPARAQAVEAEVLFREGKKLIKEGKIAEGCDKLDASARLESSVGTLLNLADCREKNGQIATAWATFQKAAGAAKVGKDEKREAEARRRQKLLEPKLSYLTISVSDANKLPGLAVSRNGTAVDPALWNASVPVDPGDYEVVGIAAGHERFSKRVHVDSGGQKTTIDVPKLAVTAGPTKPTPDKPTIPDKPAPDRTTPVQPTPEKPDGEAEVRVEPSRPSSFTSTRKIAVVVGVVGVASIGAGVYFGLHANDLEKQSDALCPTTACTDPKGVSLNSDARSSGTTATIAFGVGGAAVAGAAVLWFIGAPKAVRDDVAIAPAITPSHVGLTLVGRF
jgi:hypothetical protein